MSVAQSLCLAVRKTWTLSRQPRNQLCSSVARGWAVHYAFYARVCLPLISFWICLGLLFYFVYKPLYFVDKMQRPVPLLVSSSLSFLVPLSLPAPRTKVAVFYPTKTQEFWSLAIWVEYHHSSFIHTSPRLSAHICSAKFFITHFCSWLCTSVTRASEDPHTSSCVLIPLSHTLLLCSVSLSVPHCCPTRVLVLFGVMIVEVSYC